MPAVPPPFDNINKRAVKYEIKGPKHACKDNVEILTRKKNGIICKS